MFLKRSETLPRVNTRFSLVLAAVVLLFLAVPETGAAQVAVGVAAGDPTGLSLVIEDRLSLLIGWSLDRHTAIFLDVWLWRQLLPAGVRWYLGAGGVAEIYNDESDRGYEMERDREDPSVGLGIRVPVGIRYSLRDRLELMSEVSGNIIFFPEFTLDGHAYLGLRFVL